MTQHCPTIDFSPIALRGKVAARPHAMAFKQHLSGAQRNKCHNSPAPIDRRKLSAVNLQLFVGA
jgi:hypothetical protein